MSSNTEHAPAPHRAAHVTAEEQVRQQGIPPIARSMSWHSQACGNPMTCSACTMMWASRCCLGVTRPFHDAGDGVQHVRAGISVYLDAARLVQGASVVDARLQRIQADTQGSARLSYSRF